MSSCGSDSTLSAYEVLRLKRIARNKRKLASLGLAVARNVDASAAPPTPAQIMRRDLVNARKVRNSGEPRRKRAKRAPAGPRRTSSRNRGLSRSMQRAQREVWVRGAVGSFLCFPADAARRLPAERVHILKKRIAGADLVWDGVTHHVAKNNETPRHIAKLRGVTVSSLVKLNCAEFDGLTASSRLRAKTAITVRHTNAKGEAVDVEDEFEYRCLYLDGPRAGEEAWESQADIDSARKVREPQPKEPRLITSASTSVAARSPRNNSRVAFRRAATTPATKLSAKERAALGRFDMTSFAEWLRRGDDIAKPSSEENVRQVTARAADLASGRGVSYKLWSKPFNAGRAVTMQTNFHALMTRAVEWDCDAAFGGQGRDKGNGWAIRHPIKKLMLYQAYLYRQVRGGAVPVRGGRSRSRR